MGRKLTKRELVLRKRRQRKLFKRKQFPAIHYSKKHLAEINKPILDQLEKLIKEEQGVS